MTKKSRGPYRKSLQPSLSSDKLEELQSAFENVNRHFECPLCKTLSHFFKHGYSTHDPTQPVFVCKACKRHSTAYEVYQTLCGTGIMDANSQEVIEPSTTFQEQPSREARDAELISNLLKQVEQLATQLTQAQEQIAKFTAIINSTQQNNNSPVIPDNDFSSPKEPVSQNVDKSISQAPWRDPSKLALLKQPFPTNRQKNRIRKEEAAIRFFQPPSTNQGFQYLYVATKTRIPVGKLRTHLRNIGVNNARVLDIHYPDRNIVALLVHNDYADEFKQLLETKRIHFVNNFDPWNGSSLKDPQYQDLPEQEKTSKACEIQRQRLERSISRIREPVKFAVAYYFYQKQWLTKTFIDNLNETRYGKPEDIFDIDDDVMDDLLEDTTTNITCSKNSQQ